jgi:hypothetical protein
VLAEWTRAAKQLKQRLPFRPGAERSRRQQRVIGCNAVDCRLSVSRRQEPISSGTINRAAYKNARMCHLFDR